MLTTGRDQALLGRLNRHPQMRARAESLLAVVEDAAGDCERADAAERGVQKQARWARRGTARFGQIAGLGGRFGSACLERRCG